MVKHRKGIKQRQPGTAARPMMRYDQFLNTTTLGAAAGGTDFNYALFDNSSLAGGKYLKVGKLTTQWWADMNSGSARLYIAVHKAKEGATPESLDDEVAIRDMRSEGRLIRGPWMVGVEDSPHGLANVMYPKKTIVLEDLLLDPNDDILFAITVAETLSGTNTLRFFSRTFWRVTE